MNPPAAPPNSPLTWDHSNVHELQFPNFCNVDRSERDFTLLLGHGRPGAVPDAPVTVEVRDRITLQPAAAKLLANILQRTVASFEAEHGAISGTGEPLPGSAVLESNEEPPLLQREELSERGALLGELVQGLGAPMDVERSLKFLPSALLHERYLLTLDAAQMPESAHARFPVILKRLKMPEALIAAFEKGLPEAHSLHFGFEAQGKSCVYKAYLEPGGEAREAVREGRPGPVRLYTGFKWDPESPEKHATSEYVAHPGLALDALRERLRPFFPKKGGKPLRDTVDDLIDLAATRVESRQLLHVEVTEAGNPRASFDLNLYPAGLELAELYPLLLRIVRQYAIPLDTFRTQYERFRHRLFGHVSSGVDRAGRSFFTVYFGGRRATFTP